jgi:beta-glucosidase
MNWLNKPDPEAGGLRVEIFNNLTFDGKAVNQFTTDRPRISWSEELVHPADPGKYSARLRGTFIPPHTGEYAFGLEGNGISRLYIDSTVIVDNWPELPPGVPYWSSGQVTGKLKLIARKAYQLIIEISSENPTPWRGLQIGCLPPLPDDPIARAVDLAKKSDAVILFAGTTDEWESEGYDRVNMELPGEQTQLINSVVAANPNTVLVLNTGAPVTMDWLGKVPAVLQTWFGGQEFGNAVAAVVFGKINPSGKLPTTFPKRLRDNPAYINYPGENGKVYYGEGIFVGYRYYDFKNITNTGKTAGKETVQLYLKDVESTLVRPPKELKAFTKVHLEPGETKTLTLTLSRDSLALYDPAAKSWVSEAGEFELQVGSSSRDIRHTTKFKWKGDMKPALEVDSIRHIGLPLKVLLDDGPSKQVLAKHLGQLLKHPNFDQAIEMNLEQIAVHLPGFLTKEKLEEINKDLAEISNIQSLKF